MANGPCAPRRAVFGRGLAVPTLSARVRGLHVRPKRGAQVRRAGGDLHRRDRVHRRLPVLRQPFSGPADGGPLLGRPRVHRGARPGLEHGGGRGAADGARPLLRRDAAQRFGRARGPRRRLLVVLRLHRPAHQHARGLRAAAPGRRPDPALVPVPVRLLLLYVPGRGAALLFARVGRDCRPHLGQEKVLLRPQAGGAPEGAATKRQEVTVERKGESGDHEAQRCRESGAGGGSRSGESSLVGHGLSGAAARRACRAGERKRKRRANTGRRGWGWGCRQKAGQETGAKWELKDESNSAVFFRGQGR
mmetsp:Transcript_26592/g.59502  ORF Transcript_26592/g.59502 Transcript_26592/m.59502 type:complete len:305 (-) Transcript_26592:38-952(-)